jgi:2'-5' RNA ligase
MPGAAEMTAQPDLFGNEKPAKRRDRLFLALFPPAPVAEQIASLSKDQRDSYGISKAPLRTERFHITLHHLGDHAGFPPGLVETVKRAVATVKVAPFEVRVNKAVSFKRAANRPFVLLADPALRGVWALHKALGFELVKAGLGRHVEKDFTPHVTMLYDDAVVPEHEVPPISWRVTDFVLVHSLIGETTHIHLGRWPLQGGEA